MYVGIDPSLTGTGLVALSGDKSYSKVIHTKERGLERMKLICDEVEQFLDYHDTEIACIEGFSYGSKGKAIYEIGGLGYLLRMILYNKDYEWYEIPPSTLKKFATGKGNAKKHEVAVAVQKRWGFEAPTEDEIDAYVLARMAQALGEDVKLTSSQQQIINDMR